MKRTYRLRRNSDFHQVRRSGKHYASPLVVLAFVRNGLPYSRVGFVVNKRLGNAVKRNQIKRRMREVVRQKYEHIQSGLDIVFIARKPIGRAEYQQIEQTIGGLLGKATLISEM